jgi:hypothetical protein
MENGVPANGVHAVVTGNCPFTTVGVGNGTLAATPSSDCAVIAAGQVILGGSGSTGGAGTTWVGVDGLAHALSAIAATMENARRIPGLHTKRH